MSADRVVSREAVAEIGDVNKLRPKEEDFIGKRGYRRTYRKDGSYTWRYRFKQYDGGKRTNKSLEVQERMTPFLVADAARVDKQRKNQPVASLKDKDGNVHHVDPALAASTARQNGWSHHWRAAGSPVERGINGMLFKRVGREWFPLGVCCLGTPLKGSKFVSKRSLQLDPSGQAWRYFDGAWRKVT